jgi:CHRD domain
MRRRSLVVMFVTAFALAGGGFALGSGSVRTAHDSAALPHAGLHAVLRGDHVVHGTTHNLHVRGAFTAFIPGPFDICVGYVTLGLPRPTTAHIHRGKAGHNGPVVVELPVPANAQVGTVSGCVDTNREVVRSIRRHPERYYVEIHGSAYQRPDSQDASPGGAMRGQLFLPTRKQDR